MLDQEIIGNITKAFHLTLNYLKIYPITSQMVVAALDTFHKALLSSITNEKSITFSELSGKLLINGKETDSRDIQLIGAHIIKLFTLRTIKSITFREGLEKEELSSFLTNLIKKKKEEIIESPHIALDQTVYVAMIKGEETVVKISEIMANSGGEIVGLIKSLRESYDLIDKIPDQNAQVQAQEHLAQELAKQNTDVLKEIFEHDLPQKIESSGLKTKLLSALSHEKIQDIFGEISVWYQDIRDKESSDFAAIEQLEKLKKFMHTILQAPAAKDIPRQFFEDLLRKGLLDQIPEWFSAIPAKPATVFEVERLLEKPAADLIEKQLMDSLPGLIEKLCQIENNDVIAKLIEKQLENLKNSAPKIRLPAAQSISAIYEVLQAHSKEQLLRFIELPILDAAKIETNADVHKILVSILFQRAKQNLLLSEYDLAIRIIDLLRQHSSAEIIQDQKILSDTISTTQKLVPEIIEILISDLKSGNEKKRLGSLQIIAKIGDNAIDALVRVIKESDDLRSRRLAAIALKNMGAAAKNKVYDELNLGLNAEELKKIIEALNDLGGPEILEQLQILLQYPDPAVKKEIMKFLAKLNTSQSNSLLIEQLNDNDDSVIRETVRLLGEIKCQEAVPALTAVLNNSKSYIIKEEICIVLGMIGSFHAVNILIDKMIKRPFWFMPKKSEIERMRIRAAWSLRRFSGPEIEEALEKVSARKNDPASMTAKESLLIIVQKTPKT